MSDPRASAPPSRAKAIGWAREVVANEATIFLDTETCGKENDSQVCDIGIVAIDGTVLLDQLVRPSIPIPADASRIHGITNEMVEGAPTWREIHDRVAGIIDGRLTVIYNRAYDRAILKNEAKRDGRELDMHSECAMLAFGQFDGTPGFRAGEFKWHRLESAVQRFGIVPGGHRALADAMATRSLVLAMAASGICRSCGCTNDDCRQCVEATGVPCHWVEPDLCSRCAAAITRTVDVLDDLGIVHTVPVSLADMLDEYGFDDDEVGRMASEAAGR